MFKMDQKLNVHVIKEIHIANKHGKKHPTPLSLENKN